MTLPPFLWHYFWKVLLLKSMILPVSDLIP